MRLPRVHRGHPWRTKLLLGVIRLLSGYTAPGVVRTLFYRRDFFGARHCALSQQVMRGPSDWSVGERELMAAFISKLNRCRY